MAMRKQRLRLKIYSCGYTLEQMAAMLGLTPVTLSRRMNGHCDFTLAEVFRIGEILGITDDAELLGLFR
jgi:transcriptional regulator with XRE-family HTH domain